MRDFGRRYQLGGLDVASLEAVTAEDDETGSHLAVALAGSAVLMLLAGFGLGLSASNSAG